MYKKKRAQVTIYIILGIIILFLAVLLFYLRSTTEKGIIMQELVTSQKIPRDIRPITNYVTTNLDDAAKKGLLFIGMQGGYIYQSQSGPIPDSTKSISYNDSMVCYDITNQTSGSSFFYWPNPPDYPWKKFPGYPGGVSFPYSFSSTCIFGINNLPPLDGPDPISIQSQLKEFITNYLRNRTNLTIFDKQGFNITPGEINVSVIIGEDDITVFLDYPLIINKTLTNKITKVNYFYTNPQVRLKKVYKLTDDIINKDIVDISFDIIDIEILKNYIDDMTIEKIEDVYEYDDIIIIRDNRSMLYAEPYIFQFARENRYPALHYIDIPSSVTTIDISDIDLKADDPDEDKTFFSYILSTIYVDDKKLKDWQDLGIIITGTIPH